MTPKASAKPALKSSKADLSKAPAVPNQNDDAKTDPYRVLRQATCPKLSPKTDSHLQYEIARHDGEGAIYFRVSGNSSSGLYSKAWVRFEAVFAILDKQRGNTMKSAIIKPIVSGGSSNTCGFSCAVLRDLELLESVDGNQFLHQIGRDYDSVKVALLAMGADAKGEKTPSLQVS
ncbi:hypothetical protein [Ferrimonas senticii]|uniref:hypothetical protein n=1 Tax=Ferrimonas senticii TaxID=394566 RepID=UPI00040B3E86|nr:hypothetical protein [Ferrimonas senticii]